MAATPIRISLVLEGRNQITGDFTQLVRGFEKPMVEMGNKITHAINAGFKSVVANQEKMLSFAPKIKEGWSQFNTTLRETGALFSKLIEQQEKFLSNMSRMGGGGRGRGRGGSGGGDGEGGGGFDPASLLGGLRYNQLRTIINREGEEERRIKNYVGRYGARAAVTYEGDNAVGATIVSANREQKRKEQERILRDEMRAEARSARIQARLAGQSDYSVYGERDRSYRSDSYLRAEMQRLSRTRSLSDRYYSGRDADLEAQIDKLVGNISGYSNKNADKQAREAERQARQLAVAQARADRQAAKAAKQMSEQPSGWATSLKSVTSVVHGLGAAWRTVGNNMIRVSALFYSMERLGRLAYRLTAGPYEAVLGATANGRTFESAISGTVGGLANARAIDESVMRMSPGSALSLDEMRSAAISMTKIQPLQQALAFSSPGMAASRIGGFTNLLTQLRAINPQASMEELSHGIGEALLGQGRSLRFVARIDPNQLARLVGRDKMTAFTGNPDLLLQALQKYLSIMAPSNALDAQRNLPGVQMQHIRDQFEIAMQKIGDSGLFDNVLGRIRSFVEELARYFDPDNSAWGMHAKAMSESLSGIFKDLTGGVAALLQSMSGSQSPAASVADFVAQLDSVVRAIAADAWVLRSVGSGVGTAAHHVATAADSAVNFGNEYDWIMGNMGDPYARPGMSREDSHYRGLIRFLSAVGSWAPMISGDGRTMGPGLPPDLKRSMMPPGGRQDLHPSVLVDTLSQYTDQMRKRIGTLGGAFVPGVKEGREFSDITDADVGTMSSLLADITPDTASEMRKGNILSLYDQSVQQFRGRISNSLNAIGGYKSDNLAAFLMPNHPMHYLMAPVLSAMTGGATDVLAQTGGAREDFIKRVTGGAFELGSQELAGLRGDSLAGRTQMLNLLIHGDTDVARLTATKLGIPDAMRARVLGLGGRDRSEQTSLFGDYLNNQLQSIQKYGGVVHPGLSLEQLTSMGDTFDHATLFSPGRDTAQLQLMQAALPRMQGRYSQMLEEYNKAKPEDRTQEMTVALSDAAGQISQLTQAIHDLSVKSNEGMLAVIKLGDSFQHTLESGLSQGLTAAMTDVHQGWKKSMQEMGRGLVQDWNNFVVQNLMKGIMQGLTAALKGGGANIPQGQEGTLGGVFGGIISLFSKGGGGAAGAAMGGVFHGFTPFQAFSGGGIARGPTLGLVGERADHMPEAVVPMPGGRIPIGRDGSGIHAILPGGRKIPAVMAYAGGGMAPGFDFSRDISSGLASSGGGYSGGASGGDAVIHTHVHLDGREIATHTYRYSRKQLMNDVMYESRPGGKIRRGLGKPV